MIEDDRAHAVRAAIANGRLVTRHDVAPFSTGIGGPAILTVVDNACVLHRGSGGGCDIHHALGHGALPLACRQFPRVSLRDPRGSSVTLSHYCPTAAALLGSTPSVTIERHPPGFPADGEYVGLDAAEALPPRLRPDMLMDWDSWWLWERMSVGALAESSDAEDGLSRLRGTVEHVRSWRPAEVPLTSRIESAFRSAAAARPASAKDQRDRIEEVLASIPADIRPRSDHAPEEPAPAPGVRRDFLIAHAFANWTAHLGQGLRTWLRSLEAADALVASGFSVGTADLWLRHLADPGALADAWSAAESSKPGV